ncbi:MAG: ABC transporter permease [Clostridia bacterium]|nr:ABC transporter permease [Clostridia bacterium]
MRMMTFAKRNFKEIVRDPLNLSFLFGFPVVLLLLLSAIQANIPVSLFEIAHLSPGVAVFGLAFLTLFSATLIAKDRQSSLMQRLYTTPMTPVDFILGYTLPLIPVALAEGMACYFFAVLLGLEIHVNILLSLLLLLPVALLYIGIGLLCGSVLNDKQVGGICGALLTNLSAWLSGIWFDLELVGGAFLKVANLLPFVHAVEMQRAAIAGNFADIFPHLWWVLGYAVAILIAAVALFLRQMKQ